MNSALNPTTPPMSRWKQSIAPRWTAFMASRQQQLAAGAIALVVFIIATMMFSKSVDVVNGVPAVSNQFQADAHRALNDLQAMEPAERANYINREFPNIGRNIIAAMRDAGKLGPNQAVTGIDYLYGSADGVVAETANGGTAAGHFKDQLLAVVHTSGSDKPVVMLVFCSNGLVEFPAGTLKNMEQVGSQNATQMAFTIERGWGLNHYVDYRTSISLAERFRLPITKLDGGVWRTITPAHARQLEPDTATVRVVVRVYPGDRFNLANMTHKRAR